MGWAVPYHRGHSRSPIQPYYGRALVVGVVTAITDTPSGQRSSGPDGTLAIGIVLTDTPSGYRNYGPDGTVAIDIVLTDTSEGIRAAGPDGNVGVGVTFGPDTPAALRSGGPDGALAIDLIVTDLPGGIRFTGAPDGVVNLGVVLTDSPAAERLSGPDGSVQADTAGAVSITGDTPTASRYAGPDGVLALGVTVPGDLPSGTRFAGPDGVLVIDVVLTTSPANVRYGGPDGVPVPLLGDTSGAIRAMGPDGTMGIALPLVGDTPGGYRAGRPDGSLSIGVGADVNAGTTTPTGVRVGGPDGMLLLALIPSKPPYIPVTPTIAPRYELWLADTVTGRMLYELPADTFSWNSKLNDIGTLRTTLIIENLWDALSDQDERDPRILVREILSGPWRFSLVLKWGTTVVWAGPYISMSRQAGTSSSGSIKVELNAAEIAKMFSRRVLVAPGASSPTDVSADTVFGPNAAKPHIAATLIAQAMVGTGNALPITVVDPGGAGTNTRTYFGYDLAYYWTRLSELSAETDGPEIRFDPRITSTSSGDFVSWVTQIGSPHVGRNGTTWVFDSGVNSIVGLDGDGSGTTLGVWAAGNGQSRDKVIAHTTDTTSLAVGWPMLETVDTSRTSETLYPTLASYSASVLAAYKKPVMAFKVSVPADLNPMVGTYRVGEDFAVDIHGDPVITDGFYTRRIGAISGDQTPWVVITDTDPLPVGST